MSLPLSITLAQINPTVGDITGNMDKISAAWKEADSDLVVFPELVTCGYPPEDLVLKPSFVDAIEAAVEALVAQTKGNDTAIILPTPWRIDGKLYNAAHLIHDGKIVATRTKIHLPNYSVFDEKRLFTAGPLQDPVEFKNTKLGLMICEDMWFDDVAAHLKQNGAQILIVPNGSPFDVEKHEKRMGHAAARAKETVLPLIYVNQVGGQDELVFDGGSFVMDANGEITSQLPFFEECVSAENRHAQKPEELEAIYSALKTGLRDYVQKNGFPGILLGLSGGIDSALAAVLAVDALGPEAVECIMLPSPYTSEDSHEDAKALASALGCAYETISIEKAMHAFENTVPNLSGTAHENMQSRSRGLILMALSNMNGKMVLTTGNKSELATGYATLYGDMCGGFNALKDVYKTQVYALSRWRNEQGPVIPERIITKAPTAELKHDQTDQDTLPDYEDLDTILHHAIELEQSVSEITALGFDQETVEKVIKMLNRAEYKRYQSAPGTKITTRAFGRDRRYPMTNKF